MKVTCPTCKRRVRIRRKGTTHCKCGTSLSFTTFFRKKITYVVYLLDANIFIYATTKADKRRKFCSQLLSFDSKKIKIGTTDVVLDEIKENASITLPQSFKIYTIGKLSPELTDLKTNYLKQPSAADLSLLQAAIEHPEIKGIITYDRDFGRIAARGLIQQKSSSHFWLGNAREFLQKYEIRSKLKKPLVT